ncbi:MAG: Na+/H+ antiporter subunit E [Polyangiaceae bacterium]|nr:Na+/H+ antiporter subunit E [Polyangiaceae bacterium]MCW5789470.1 Na+/H+ antiporter subunit E [Polyangiaceae bacterium]
MSLLSLPRRALGFCLYLACFFKELWLANLSLAKAVLRYRPEDTHPGFIEYPTAGLSRFEVLILSHSITLTPGTTTVRVADDMSSLLIHAFDARAPSEVREAIQRGLEVPLLRWTR